MRLASRWFKPQKLALASGVIVTIGMLGGIASQAPLTVLVTKFGWRFAMQLNAGLGIIFLLLIMVLVKDYPPGFSKIISNKNATSLSYLWVTIKKALSNPQNWLFGLYTSLLNLPVFLLGALWGSFYLVQVHFLHEAQATYVTSMIFVGTIIGSPVLGLLSDKLASRRKPMLVCALLAIVLINIIMFVPHLNFVELMALFFLLGFITSAQVISYPAIAECNPVEITGSSLSIASVIIMLGGVLFQPLFSLLMDWHWNGYIIKNVPWYAPGNYKIAMTILPIAFVVGLIAVWLAKETAGQQA
jgi:nitrate/nitrite transporter NarK